MWDKKKAWVRNGRMEVSLLPHQMEAANSQGQTLDT